MQFFVAIQQSCRGSGRRMKRRKRLWGGGEQGGGGEEEEITTPMQFSTAMQHSCTRGRGRRWRRRKRRRRRRPRLQCSLPQQCSRVVLVGQGICFFPLYKEEEKEEEEGNKQQEEEDRIRTAMQFYTAIEHSCTREPRKLFPVNKEEQ